MADFHGSTSQALKNRKYLSGFSEDGLLDVEFILLLNDTKTSKNKRLFAEKSHFSKENSKKAILAKIQRRDL